MSEKADMTNFDGGPDDPYRQSLDKREEIENDSGATERKGMMDGVETPAHIRYRGGQAYSVDPEKRGMYVSKIEDDGINYGKLSKPSAQRNFIKGISSGGGLKDVTYNVMSVYNDDSAVPGTVVSIKSSKAFKDSNGRWLLVPKRQAGYLDIRSLVPPGVRDQLRQ